MTRASCWVPRLLSMGLLVAGGCARDTDFVREVKARKEIVSVRTDRDGTVHARHRDGREMWFTLEDQQKRRFHFRQDGVVRLAILDLAGVPTSIPPDVSELVVHRGAVQLCPSWITPYPRADIEPAFAALTERRVRGSWTFETDDDTSVVRMFYADQLAAFDLSPRRGVAPKPARDLPVVIDAGRRGADRFVQIRMGPGPGAGAHGEVYYEYRR